MEMLFGAFLPELTILGILTYTLGGLLRMFLIFVLGFTLKNNNAPKIIQLPLFIYGFLYDIFLNWWLSLLTFDMPDAWDETITNRMKRYKRDEPASWKGKFSFWMCKKLNRYDEGHC